MLLKKNHSTKISRLDLGKKKKLVESRRNRRRSIPKVKSGLNIQNTNSSASTNNNTSSNTNVPTPTVTTPEVTQPTNQASTTPKSAKQKRKDFWLKKQANVRKKKK